jgi:hypothetical protein
LGEVQPISDTSQLFGYFNSNRFVVGQFSQELALVGFYSEGFEENIDRRYK